MVEVLTMGRRHWEKAYDVTFYTCLLVGVIFVTVNLQSGSSHEVRNRRDLANLAIMMSVKLQKNAMDFINYGHFCGFLGEGNPVDEIDKCCQDHDNCYYDIVDKPGACCTSHSNFSVYFITYRWNFVNKTIHCEPEKGLSEKEANCSLCMCECDRTLARCLYKYLKSYNPLNLHPLLWRLFDTYISSLINNYIKKDNETKL